MDDDRTIVRCPHCNLRQFLTNDGNCRKCHKFLLSSEEVQPEPEPPPPPPPPEKINDGWGWMFATIRQQRGFSQRQLSIKAKCVRTFISKMEGRYEPPTLATVERFAHALEVPMSVLASADDGRAYLCREYLFSDPFVNQVYNLAHGLSEQQHQIILSTVRNLLRDHQYTFPEWQTIPAMSSKEVAA
jgi:transcriptional regulator with XRE-family HTH domain